MGWREYARRKAKQGRVGQAGRHIGGPEQHASPRPTSTSPFTVPRTAATAFLPRCPPNGPNNRSAFGVASLMTLGRSRYRKNSASSVNTKIVSRFAGHPPHGMETMTRTPYR